MAGKDLLIRVLDIRGRCPVYQKGHEFRILEGFKLDTERPLCMHSLSSLMPYYVALSRGILPKELGLTRGGQAAYLQCLDPCEHTGGGTVVFEILSIDSEDEA